MALVSLHLAEIHLSHNLEVPTYEDSGPRQAGG
jgi:hypothetical protein